MTASRRWLLQALSASMMAGLAAPATQASEYPNRPVTLVVPIAPGGGVDALARILAERLRGKLGQSVLVENRPGAGSVIGATSVVKSAADGYTLLLLEPAAIIAKWLNKNVTYDVETDFDPVALVATQPLVLFAHPSVASSTLPELIETCRQRPKLYSVGTAGVGSPHHLAALWLNDAAKIDIVHQPYRGAGPALNDLLGGHIPLIWALPAPVLPYVADGRVKAIAVSTTRRFVLLPQTPTVAEASIPGFDVEFFYGVAAPAGTPADIKSQLSKALLEVTREPGFASQMTGMGIDVAFRNPDSFRSFVRENNQRFANIVRSTGATGN